MSSPADFADYCAELLAPAGAVRSRRMFGGYGLYVDDLFVAIIVQDTLYLKTDDESRHRFEEAGGRKRR
jgi:DNA transformation protein